MNHHTTLQVAGKRWRVDLMSRQEAALALSAVHLPGGAQRRRNAEDELRMREVLKEADLVSVSGVGVSWCETYAACLTGK
jgi:exosome complex RNA-binding protein Rrp4